MNTIQKERQKRDERLAQARQWADEDAAENEPAFPPPSCFIQLNDHDKTINGVGAAYVRVSDRHQAKSIESQTNGMVAALQETGIAPPKTITSEIANGKRTAKNFRPKLHQALETAGKHPSKSLLTSCVPASSGIFCSICASIRTPCRRKINSGGSKNKWNATGLNESSRSRPQQIRRMKTKLSFPHGVRNNLEI